MRHYFVSGPAWQVGLGVGIVSGLLFALIQLFFFDVSPTGALVSGLIFAALFGATTWYRTHTQRARLEP